ncbi:DnaJ domain-containing protein [Xylaria acuta]|nr:DnaJ domain-containing protein [Xylaria acuta]
MTDHYVVLGIQQTATTAEITAAYRRLAMIHHPDKNPDNVDEATERFKKIHQAYEVLSDDSKRRQYDARQNTNPPTTGAHDDGGGGGTYYYYDYYYAFEWHLEEVRRRMDAQVYAFVEGQRKQREEWERQQRERQERLRERSCKEAREREAKVATKQAQKDEMERERKVTIDQEASKQQARWQRKGATTEEAKFLACLHSSFCTKIQRRKKFRCDACGARRGITAFECPHCSRHLCQLCVTNFASERALDAA